MIFMLVVAKINVSCINIMKCTHREAPKTFFFVDYRHLRKCSKLGV